MISIISLVLALTSLTSSVSGLVPHSPNLARHARHVRELKAPNSDYDTYLEDYTGYHCRYINLKCHEKHNTTFFEDCCHPLLATESVEKNRPQKCQPPDEPCDKDGDVPTPYDNEYKDKPKPPPEHKASGEPPKAKGDNKSHDDDKPKKAADVGGGGNDGDLNRGGFATFFTQDGNAGACGIKHGDGDMIAAMNVERYGFTGVHSPICGKHVKITNTQNHKSVTVEIADACPGCKNSNSIDLSTGAFNQIAKPEEGLVPIEWAFV